MSRPRKVAARYLKHASGRARVLWNDSTGRRVRLLPGLFNSPESLEAFARIQLELASTPDKPLPSLDGPTVVEILAPYIRHAEAYYGLGSELKMIRDALKIVRQLYGANPVAEFGPRKLAAVREAFIRKGWSRGYINRQVGKIVRCFKWASSEELVPVAIYQGLKTLAPLRHGHCEAPEPDPVQPANPEHVAETMPFLPPHVRVIVDLLRCTGMRPSEACRMTLAQIDRTGPIWTYRSSKHKNAHRGKFRAVSLGKDAQLILNAHFEGRTIADADPIFSPRLQKAEKAASLRANRKSKVQPSQVNRKKEKPKRPPGEWFKAAAVGHAVARACKKANVPLWSPYQLRHLKGAELRERFSLEHVRAALGHSHASMTAHLCEGSGREVGSRSGGGGWVMEEAREKGLFASGGSSPQSPSVE